MASAELAQVRKVSPGVAPWRGRRPPVRPLVGLLLAGDLAAAGELCDRFLVRARRRVNVMADLLQPAQYRIGELWYQGRIGLEDELRVARLVDWLVDRLPPTPTRSPVPAGSRCLLAMLPDDAHSLGLRMFALALEDEGWEVELVDGEYVHADLPPLVDRVRPKLVGLSAGYVPAAQGAVARLVAAIRDLSVPVLVGGAAFNRVSGLWRRVGAAGHGADVRVGTVLARRLAR